jgi:hypothetical protein
MWDDLLEVANNRLLFKFEDLIYLQTRGLAMGVADSPDLANLYGYFYEKQCFRQPADEIAFYKRYIDDIFSIVIGPETADLALKLISEKVTIEGCKITWVASDLNAVFLDMFVYRDLYNPTRVHYRPYSKARNHLERVPWISAHPLDVKKGTYIGELTRLASLNSNRIGFQKSCTDLANLYISRGYPEKLVNSWHRQYASRRWEQRLKPQRNGTGNVLVLKSEFNQAWDWFNASDLGRIITSSWEESLSQWDLGVGNTGLFPPEDVRESECPLHSPGSSLGTTGFVADVRKLPMFENSRWLVSRRRTTNLFDMVSTWKKCVLSKTAGQVDDQMIDVADFV